MNILILGSGYIGVELFYTLKEKHRVTLTTRSLEKQPILKQLGAHVILLDTKDKEALIKLIPSYDIIIVTVAPKCLNDYEKTYLKTALNIAYALKKAENLPRQLIYTSSSSVYGDQLGKVTDEKALLKTTTQFGKILIETEKIFLSLEQLHIDVCIFRLSEIYGPSRELSARVKRLAELSAPGDGLSYTNMIHRDDVCHAIAFAITQKLKGIFNLTDNDHIKRKDMYDLISKKFALPLVMFDSTKTSIHSGNKILSNDKIKERGYLFKYPQRVYS